MKLPPNSRAFRFFCALILGASPFAPLAGKKAAFALFVRWNFLGTQFDGGRKSGTIETRRKTKFKRRADERAAKRRENRNKPRERAKVPTQEISGRLKGTRRLETQEVA